VRERREGEEREKRNKWVSEKLDLTH